MNENLDKHIESFLFWKGEPVLKKELCSIFNIGIPTLERELAKISERYISSGITLKNIDDRVCITTSSETSEIIEQIIKSDLDKELSKASIETLSIIIYRGPIKRAEIDYIRGVSSQFILRNLQVRGLVDKVVDPIDTRIYFYKPSIELLNYLGINDTKEMLEYAEVNKDINDFYESEKDNEGANKQNNTEEIKQ
jgi:segregation and condensation protein B